MTLSSHQKISFTLSREDYLRHLLYASSKTPSVIRKRKINRIVLPILYLSIAVFGIFQNNMSLFASFAILSVLWFWYFPKWESGQYIKQYNKYLDRHIQEKVGKEIQLEFTPEQIVQTEDDTQYIIPYDQIRGWYETSYAVYIGLLDNYTIIIPKHLIEKDELNLIEKITRNNTKDISFPFVKDLDWEWS